MASPRPAPHQIQVPCETRTRQSLQHHTTTEINSRRCRHRKPSHRGSACPKRAHFHFASRFNKPLDSRTCWTPWSVFQDGSGGLPITLTWREVPAKPALPYSDRHSNPFSTPSGHHLHQRCRLPVRRGPRGPSSGSPPTVLEGEIKPKT